MLTVLSCTITGGHQSVLYNIYIKALEEESKIVSARVFSLPSLTHLT